MKTGRGSPPSKKDSEQGAIFVSSRGFAWCAVLVGVLLLLSAGLLVPAVALLAARLRWRWRLAVRLRSGTALPAR